MPPRTKRTGEGSSSPAPPTKKAKEKVDASSRGIHAERNLAMVNPENNASAALVTLRQFVVSNYLVELATSNERYNEAVVRDFYESFPGGITLNTKEVTLKVRGKKVVLNREVIDTILNLPRVSDEEEEAYFEAISSMPPSSLNGITYSDPSVYTSQNTTSLMCGNMTEEYRAFWLFVRNNLLPTTQKSEVPMESCKLLIQMRRGERAIPYPRLILSSILGSALRGTLFFPCLITRICENARVPVKKSDPIFNAFGVLDERSFAKSATQVGRSRGASQPSVAHGAAAPTSSPFVPFDPRMVDPNTHAMIQHYHGLTMDRLDSMEALVRQISEMMPRGGNDESGPGMD